MLVVDVTVSVAFAVPLGARTKLAGWMLIENPAGGVETARPTVAEKPLRLTRVTLDNADEFDWDSASLEGVAEIAKSGVVGIACTASAIEIQVSTAGSLNVTGKPLTVALTISYSAAFVPGGVKRVKPGPAAGKQQMFP